MTLEGRQKSNRVLIADDDPVMRCLIASVVTNEGYFPVVVSDGREAYQILRSDADFQGALLDMTMPCLNGIDLVHYMRSEKRLQKIPIMMITAEQDLKLMSDSFTAGATAYLPKTFTRELLQNALRMLLRTPAGTRVAA